MARVKIEPEEKEIEKVLITPIEFADVSILKDKINEIIAFLNR